MEIVKNNREIQKISQRYFAKKAGLSYKALQLVEKGNDTRISTLNRIAHAFGYDRSAVTSYLKTFFSIHPQSLSFTALSINQDGFDSWKIHLYNFIDQFRKSPTANKIQIPPLFIENKPATLLTSTTESLCEEFSMPIPNWCAGICALEQPWFVSGVAALKATSLVESPAHFRKRNIFVLANFLERF